MNNYLYNYPDESQEYNKYQQPPHESYGAVPGSTTYQSLLSKVLTLLSFSLVSAGFGLFAGLQLLDAGIGGVFFFSLIFLVFVLFSVIITFPKPPHPKLSKQSFPFPFSLPTPI